MKAEGRVQSHRERQRQQAEAPSSGQRADGAEARAKCKQRNRFWEFVSCECVENADKWRQQAGDRGTGHRAQGRFRAAADVDGAGRSSEQDRQQELRHANETASSNCSGQGRRGMGKRRRKGVRKGSGQREREEAHRKGDGNGEK